MTDFEDLYKKDDNKTFELQKNYSAFINTLKAQCKNNSINAGKLKLEPFSLGKVYFKQKTCRT